MTRAESTDDPTPALDRDRAEQVAYARSVDQLLRSLHGFSQLLEETVGGSLSREAAWRTLRSMTLEAFDQGLPLRSSADPVLLQLVREAFEIINDRDSSLDRREWTKEARKALRKDPAESE